MISSVNTNISNTTAATLGQNANPDIDRSEYQLAFQILDPERQGEVTIDRVYDLLNKLEGDQPFPAPPKQGEEGEEEEGQPKPKIFPNGKPTIQLDDFINEIVNASLNEDTYENCLIHAFSLFDRDKKGYLSENDLKEVFEILGQSVSDEELTSMIKMVGNLSKDKITYHEFKEFFKKDD